MDRVQFYQQDIEAILARKHDNGGDYWASTDGRIFVGNPFSTLICTLLLTELGMDNADPVLLGAAELILGAWREDGRFKITPTGTIYPCQTALAARALCAMGYAGDERLCRTFEHLLETQHTDGGWRCNKFFYGRGPETEYSNPGPTLEVLDVFRFTPYLNLDQRLDNAVDFLLNHWEIRKPIGPCHYGIGSQFMKIEYPFLRYNLFYYVYVLSFYNKAKRDTRFLSALQCLQSSLVDGKIVVEYINRKFSELSFCAKGKPSILATTRYSVLLQNLHSSI